MDEGRVNNNNFNLQYVYDIKDHLGNVRVSFVQSSPSPQVVDKNFYYPFGLTVDQVETGYENKYKYNGKELEDDHNLNWYHYGARYYDPQLGRWHTIDPVDEFLSPYQYGPNNPINGVDPDGRGWDDGFAGCLFTWYYTGEWMPYTDYLKMQYMDENYDGQLKFVSDESEL